MRECLNGEEGEMCDWVNGEDEENAGMQECEKA
jgi:hypothetical protein